jgi:hypothetical protein
MSYPAPRRNKAVIIAFLLVTGLLHWLLLFGGMRITQRALAGGEVGPLNIEVVLAAPVVVPPPKPAPPPAPPPPPPKAAAPKPPEPAPPVVIAPPPPEPPVAVPAPIEPPPAPPPEPAPPPPQEAPVNAVAITLPTRMTLTYDLGVGTGDEIPRQGSNITRWTFENGKYSIDSVAEAAGLIRLFYGGQRIETSRGSVAADGLAPEQYGEERPKRKSNVYFARDAKTITFSEPAGNVVPLPSGVQDRLSVQFQLGAMLQALPELREIGRSVTMQVAGQRTLDRWTFTVRSQEQMQVDGTTVPALRLTKERRADRDYDRAVEVWLAPSLNWLPVRIRVIEPSGRMLEQTLAKVPN